MKAVELVLNVKTVKRYHEPLNRHITVAVGELVLNVKVVTRYSRTLESTRYDGSSKPCTVGL